MMMVCALHRSKPSGFLQGEVQQVVIVIVSSWATFRGLAILATYTMHATRLYDICELWIRISAHSCAVVGALLAEQLV